MFREDYELNPEKPTAEEAEQVSTIDGMYERLREFAMYDPLTRSIFTKAEAEGLDKSELLTLLAFFGMSRSQRLLDTSLKMASMQTHPPIYFVNESGRLDFTKQNGGE